MCLTSRLEALADWGPQLNILSMERHHWQIALIGQASPPYSGCKQTNRTFNQHSSQYLWISETSFQSRFCALDTRYEISKNEVWLTTSSSVLLVRDLSAIIYKFYLLLFMIGGREGLSQQQVARQGALENLTHWSGGGAFTPNRAGDWPYPGPASPSDWSFSSKPYLSLTL